MHIERIECVHGYPKGCPECDAPRLPDLTLTRSGELDVTQVEGNTPTGISFVDLWMQDEMVVVDAGRIIVRNLDALERAAAAEKLSVERAVVRAEGGDGMGFAQNPTSENFGGW